MKTLSRFYNTWTRLSLAVSLSLAGCAAEEQDEATAIASELEMENGGLDMEDEAPMFGDEVLAALDTADLESDYSDAMETDAGASADLDAVDGARYGVTLLWGQLPPDPGVETVRDWSGRISVNRGAILVRRVIRFEDAGDRVLDRTDRRAVDFVSHTRPANDGLRLLVGDPTPGADEPLTLTYTRPDGEMFSATIDELLAEPIVREVDDRGNRIVVVALRRADDACDHGFLAGRWHKVADGRGRLAGIVSDAEGNPIGHMRGVYGRRDSGERVFFGKYIGRDGRFRGIFAGHYGEGHFVGRWLSRSGEHGRLGGVYRETIPGREVGGHFLGRWAETSCATDLPEGTPIDS